MSSPASVKNHPLHPMLVALPIGLWTFAFVCDVATVMGRGDPWSTVGTYAIAGGIIGALLAAVPGFIDYLSIDEKEMKKIATTHLLLALGRICRNGGGCAVAAGREFTCDHGDKCTGPG